MSPWAELAEVAVTFYVLYLLSLLAARMRHPAAPTPVPAEADGGEPPVIPEARDTEPYRMDGPVAVGASEAARYETVEVAQ